MIESIKDLRILDEKISEEFGKAISHLRFLLFESDFKNMSEVCFMFMGNSDSLKNSIINCAEKGDYYSANVLYRSLTEHYFRFKYFYFSHSSFKDDSYAFKFRTSLDFIERMAIESALNSARQIKGQQMKSKEVLWERLINSNKKFEKFTKVEIAEFTQNLAIKNIIRFLEKMMGPEGRESDTFLQERIIEYAHLSSFVHGGLHAHKELIKIEAAKNKHEIYFDLCGPALQMATSIKIFSYLAIYQFMPAFGEYYTKSQELMKLMKEGR